MTEIVQIIENEVTIVTEASPNVIEVNRGGPQGRPGSPGPQGPSVSDGDKGDVVVSGSGASWTIDPTLLSAFMRGVTASANEAAFKASVNLEVGVDVQAYSPVLSATTASFLTTHATKLGHIAVTQAVDLDAIEARVNELDAAIILKGVWDASAGTFPGAGAAQAGWSYIVSVAGTVGGVAFAVNDRLIAVADNASTTVFASNWFKADYTDQVLSVAGKTGALTLQVADITDMSANGRSLVSAANYAAMQTLLGNDLKAPLASPALTGNPTAPTPSPGDNDTSIATTAFVTAAVAAISGATTPRFAVRRSADQTAIATATFTKIQFNVEDFDDGAYFDSTTNYRYTPPAGKYLITLQLTFLGIAAAKLVAAAIYKNGSLLRFSTHTTGGSGDVTVSVSGMFDMNGTDYIEGYCYHEHGSNRDLRGGAIYTGMFGHKI